jgi:hypothetical protein
MQRTTRLVTTQVATTKGPCTLKGKELQGLNEALRVQLHKQTRRGRATASSPVQEGVASSWYGTAVIEDSSPLTLVSAAANADSRFTCTAICAQGQTPWSRRKIV